jgi:sporulation protein YlmC with PRC-barrel domain
MPTPRVEDIRAWLGRVMVDCDGNRLGEIADIYLDRETDRPG